MVANEHITGHREALAWIPKVAQRLFGHLHGLRIYVRQECLSADVLRGADHLIQLFDWQWPPNAIREELEFHDLTILDLCDLLPIQDSADERLNLLQRLSV